MNNGCEPKKASTLTLLRCEYLSMVNNLVMQGSSGGFIFFSHGCARKMTRKIARKKALERLLENRISIQRQPILRNNLTMC